MTVPHSIAYYNTLQLAEVQDNNDPEARGRVQILIHASQMQCWAPVMVNSAGENYGVSFLPKIGEIVVIAFVSRDQPVIMGSLWSGQNSQTDDDGQTEDRYSITTPSGSVLEFLEQDGSTKIEMKTAQGQTLTLTEQNGGEITIQTGSENIKLSSSGISIESSSKVEVNAPQVNVSTSLLKVDSGMSQFSGVVKCSTLISDSVVSSAYTPGAGNIW